MPYTREQYETLSAAIATGQRRVQYGDRTVEYRSLDEMLRIQALMAQELGQIRQPNRVLASFQKGLAK